MPESFDVSKLQETNTRWVRVGLDDMEVQIRRVTPEQFAAFQRRMVSHGIVKKGKDFEINPGRFMDYHKAWAREFVTGWKNLIVDGQENPPYDPDKMGFFMGQSVAIQSSLGEAMTEEQAFFSRNGSGSSG